MKYSTPSLRPADTSASLIACDPPTAIAAGSKDSTSGRLCTSPCRPGTSSGKQPVDVVHARMNSVRSSSRLEEVVRELAHAHELVDLLDAHVRDREQLLQRVRVRRRRREAVLA